MAQITIYAAICDAATKLPNGRERRLLERAAELLDFRVPHNPLGDAGGRLIDFDEDESTKQIGHICPHCKREPAKVSMHPLQFGPIPAYVASCSDCRKVLTVGLMPIPPEPMMQQSSPSGLIRPF